MNYEQIPTHEGVVVDHSRDDFHKWLYEDCNVVECIEGNIYKLVEGIPALYNCPVCTRTTVTPGRRIWRGAITLRTEEAMVARMKERMDLVRKQTRTIRKRQGTRSHVVRYA